MIRQLTYELGVLAQAVKYKNLLAASQHVGLSQPQLSRIIRKLEAELKIQLLNRSSKRTASWTPVAERLALAYLKNISRFEAEISQLTSNLAVTEIHFGTLEGLIPLAHQMTISLLARAEVNRIFVDVFDFYDLNSRYQSGELDVIMSVQLPENRKSLRHQVIGYQDLQNFSSNEKLWIGGPMDWSDLPRKDRQEWSQAIISNSLQMRSLSLKQPGGTGYLPVNSHLGGRKGKLPIYVIASDSMDESLWLKILELLKSLGEDQSSILKINLGDEEK